MNGGLSPPLPSPTVGELHTVHEDHEDHFEDAVENDRI